MTETTEIRLLDWRDLTLLHRVRDLGLCLTPRLAYTRGPQALQHALLDAITPGRTTFTLVVRPAIKNELAGVGQISLSDNQDHAHVTFVGPSELFSQPGGVALLEGLAQAAGGRGAHNLIAEVDEDSKAFLSLRRGGFAIYARQRIWRRNNPPESAPGGGPPAWRPEKPSDEPAIHGLYVDLVPALVQQVESAPTSSGQSLVHWQEGELLGYLDIERGPLGVWVQPYFHPAAEKLDKLLTSFLSQFAGDSARPWHICVRSYQGWVNATLEELGFEPYGDQAVMVKRLAAAVRHPARARLPQLEGTRPEPTAPFMNMKTTQANRGVGRES